MVLMVDPSAVSLHGGGGGGSSPSGRVFFRGNSLFFVSEGEKSPNGMPLRREREGGNAPFAW